MAVVKFSKQIIEPNPLEVDYWVDINSDPYGSVWKYHNGINWVALDLAGGSGGGGLSPFDYYTKTQINDLLADKADIDFVESKVDDAEFAKVIQNIEFRPIGDNSVELVMLKYDGIVVGITMPVASETTAGLLSGDDFKNFVKQTQLLRLYSEMYEIVAKIREDYQPRLKAGSNIYIDEKTNTISATGELSVDWNNIPNIPVHLTSSVSTKDEVINVDETFTTQVLRKNEQILTEDEKELVRTNINVSDKNTVDKALSDISELQSGVVEAINTANTAKTIVTTLEGLANADEAMLTLAGQVALIEENKLNIQLQEDKITELASKVGFAEYTVEIKTGVAFYPQKHLKVNIKAGEHFIVNAISDETILNRYRIYVWYSDGNNEIIDQYGSNNVRKEYIASKDIEYIGFAVSSDFSVADGVVIFRVEYGHYNDVEILKSQLKEANDSIQQNSENLEEVDKKADNLRIEIKAVESILNISSSLSDELSLTTRNRYYFFEDGVMAYAPSINYQIKGVLNDSDKEKFYRVVITKPSDNTVKVGMVGYADGIASKSVVIAGGDTNPTTDVDVEVVVPPNKMLLLSIHNTFGFSVREIIRNSDVDVVKSQVKTLYNTVEGFSKTIDTSSLSVYYGIILNGEWVKTVGNSTNNKHGIYQLDGSEKYILVTTNENRNYNASVAFLSEIPTYPVEEQVPVNGLLMFHTIIAPSTEKIKVPDGSKYLYILIQQQGSDRTPRELVVGSESLQQQISDISPTTTDRIVLNVDASGNGDFIGLHEAMKFCVSNPDKNYEVRVSEGIYDVGSEWSDEELSNANYPSGFYGTIVPTNVNIIGIGSYKNIIITAKGRADYTFADTWTHISTINVHGGSLIKNVTIKAEGSLRYAVHDDFSSSKNKTTTYEDSEIIFNDTNAHSSLGCGSHDGQVMNIINCTIEPTLGWHGHNPATNGSTLNVRDSIIGSIALGEYNTKFEQQINIDNTKCGFITYGVAAEGIKQWMKVRVTNCQMPIITDLDFDYSMSGIDKCIATSNTDVKKGDAVCKASAFAVSPIINTKGFYGIALEDIAKTSGRVGAPNWGKVLTKGYIPSTLIGLSSLSVGDKIGLVNGTYSVVTDDWIGSVEFIYNSVAYIKI